VFHVAVFSTQSLKQSYKYRVVAPSPLEVDVRSKVTLVMVEPGGILETLNLNNEALL